MLLLIVRMERQLFFMNYNIMRKIVKVVIISVKKKMG